MIIQWQVAEEAASKAKGAAQETYQTATDYGSAAYEKVRSPSACKTASPVPCAAWPVR